MKEGGVRKISACGGISQHPCHVGDPSQRLCKLLVMAILMAFEDGS